MASSPLDQLAALASVFGSSFAIVLPERRRPDAVTFVHTRAADRVHAVASWLLRGADLAIVTQRTPFLAETAQDLWEYYKSLPLEQRADRLIALFIALELMQSSGVLTRQQHPRLRRLIDVYTGAVGLACFMPRRVFYHLHRGIWAYEMSRARGSVHEPAMPMLLSNEAEAAIRSAMASAWGMLGGQSSTTTPSATSSGVLAAVPWRATALACAALGAGGALAWCLGAEAVRRRWLQLQRDVASFTSRLVSL